MTIARPHVEQTSDDESCMDEVCAGVGDREADCTATRELDTDLGWGLGAVFRYYVRLVDEAFGDTSGGPRGYQVLASAARDQPASQQALAKQLGIDRTVMTYLIDDLVADGLVTRESDPADRRARRVVATEAGTQRLAALNEALASVEARILTPLDERARESFREMLVRLAVNADSALPTASTCTVVNDPGMPL